MRRYPLLIFIVLLFILPSSGQTTDGFHFKEAKRLIDLNNDSCLTHIYFFENKENNSYFNYLMGLHQNKQKDYKNSNFHLKKVLYGDQNIEPNIFRNLNYQIANNFFFQNEYDSSEVYLRKTVQIENIANSKINLSDCYFKLGRIYRLRLIIDSALHYNNLSLQGYKVNNDSLGIAKAYSNLGNTYKTFDADISIKYYLKALAIYKALKHPQNTAILEHNLGVLFIDRFDFLEGLKYLERSLSFFESIQHIYFQTITLNNIGYAYLNLNQLKKAKINLELAIAINHDFEDALAFSYLNLGNVYDDLGDPKKAYELYKLNETLCISHTLYEELIKVYSKIVPITIELGDYKAFHIYFKKYNDAIYEYNERVKKESLAKFEQEFEIKESKHLLSLALKDKTIKEQEINQQNIQLNSKNNLLFLGISIIFLLLILVVIILFYSRKHRRLNQEINSQNLIIKNHNQKLEEKVKQRTSELNISKLKAEESDLLKSTFLANISHEIRTPLNSIMGFSDLLTEEQVDMDAIPQYGTIIRNKGYELLNIINDIIDVSKIEANMFMVDKQNTNYSSFIEMIQNNHFDKAKYYNKEHTIEYRTCFMTEDVIVHSDLTKLEVVFDKLINNAFQFTDKGFIEIGSKIQDHKILFYVSDSGIGIPNERLIQVFENFRQFKMDEQFKYHGLGVGLYIANHILSRLGTKLNIESNTDEGSTFSFSLDIVDG